MIKKKLGIGKLFCLATVLLLSFNLFASSYVSFAEKNEVKSTFLEKNEKTKFSTFIDSDKSDLLFEEESLEEEEESSEEKSFLDLLDLEITFSFFQLSVFDCLFITTKNKYEVQVYKSVPRWLLVRHILI